MNRAILRLAIPNIISSITIPLMGLISTALAGRMDGGVAAIGALAVGVNIFNFIYWNCSFIRMGTSGLTAQAYGRGDVRECTNMLVRGLGIAAILGVVLVAAQWPIGWLCIRAMNGGDVVREYFFVRIWAVPAGLMLYGFNGWYNGMQNAVIPMATSLTVNVLHIGLSIWFVFGHGMGIEGIAYANVVAQWGGMLLAVVLLWINYRRVLVRFRWSEVVDWAPVKAFFVVNRDIIIRTVCVVGVYTFFTAISAWMDPVLLTVNALLMQIFMLYSYMNDGLTYAAEALAGRFFGARDTASLRLCVNRCIGWGFGIAMVFVGLYAVGWRELMGVFTSDADVIATAGRYMGWVIAIPLVSAFPFTLDGVLVGVGQTKVMRNSMVIATVCFFGVFTVLYRLLGNDALWISFMLYVVLRGVMQFFMTGRLRGIYHSK